MKMVSFVYIFLRMGKTENFHLPGLKANDVDQEPISKEMIQMERHFAANIFSQTLEYDVILVGGFF